MSSSSLPIPPHRFAEAIAELPLPNLYTKAAELQNSISHLSSSNQQLHEYAEDGDAECAQAIEENGQTIRRMEERLALLKGEVESRGSRWVYDDYNAEGKREEEDAEMDRGVEEGRQNGDRDMMDVDGPGEALHVSRNSNELPGGAPTSGRQGNGPPENGSNLEDEDDDDGGLHL